LVNGLLYFIAEVLGLLYTAHLYFLVEFIRSDEQENDVERGVVLVIIFAVLMLLQAVMRNLYIFKGYVTAVKIRKTIVSALFSKITSLSAKSVAQTS
jgi:ABC-type transport system involved in cytochrome bd biosynthesis fused ATPase/permease subunit